MSQEEKIHAAERENRVWAIWAFLGSELVLAQLKAKNPNHNIRRLIIPIKAVRSLQDEILWSIYDRLHGRDTIDGSQPLNILHDLLQALREFVDQDLALV